jgi:DNA polymerase
LLRHWRSVPAELAELLETCLEEQPEQRPRDFQMVLNRLDAIGAPPASSGPVLSLPVASPAPASTVGRLPVANMTIEQRQQELAVLAKQVSACTRCSALVSSRTQTVFGVGPLDPEICFLGEAPGADEDRTGEPFIGAAGQVFNDLLRAVGLRREDVYIANMLKCRPPGNRTPLPIEINNCRGFLNRQLELIRPKYICTLGGCASQNLLNSPLTIGKLRGRFHDYKGISVLCTYHPAFLLPSRSPEKKRDVIDDLKLLLRRMGRPVAR